MIDVKKLIINFIFIFFILVSFFIFLKGLNNFEGNREYSYFLFFLRFLLNFLSLLFLFSSDFEKKKNFLIVIFFSYATLFLINFFLILNNFYNPHLLRDKEERIKIAKKTNTSFDERSKLDVILDLRKKNKEAYSVVFPSLNKYSKDNDLKPLSAISNVLTVYGNETGKYLIYKSDRYGFNNEDSIYDEDTIEYLIIGDSFAHGANVAEGEDVASVLRKKGYNSITIGMGANGPLRELGSLIEYGVNLKPKKILWFHYSNDLRDLHRELEDSQLKKYMLEDGFKQNLIIKQKEIDQVLKKFHDKKFQQYLKKNSGRFVEFSDNSSNFFSKNNLWKFITLFRIRNLLNLDKGAFIKENKITKETKKNFMKIFSKACKIADKNNAQFFLINLTSFNTLSKGKTYENKFTENFLENFFVNKINFGDYILKQNNFKSFFPFGIDGHYSKEGYEILSEIILENTKKDELRNCNYDIIKN